METQNSDFSTYQGNESSGNAAKDMKKQARKRADQKSGLDIRQTVEPVEKTLNRLTDGTDEGRESITGNQDIAFVPFPWGEQFQGMVFLQRLSPSSVSVGFVSI